MQAPKPNATQVLLEHAQSTTAQITKAARVRAASAPVREVFRVAEGGGLVDSKGQKLLTRKAVKK